MDSLEFKIHTFGCKVNTYDTGLLQKKLESRGFVSKTEPKVHILNTCAVTAEATKEAVRTIRRIKAKDPLSLVVVTGCAAQVDTDQFEPLKSADLIVANSHKGELDQLIRKYYSGELRGERIFKSNIFRKLDLEEGGGIESEHTRSFLKIQDGCNSFCTYCVIPFARGRSRSISIERLIQSVNELYSKGVREVVLTGVHIGDYEDHGRSLEDLVENLCEKTLMPRFRLSSLEPVEVTERLLSLYEKHEKLCPHFHMSIQSANTKVLSEMKRKYKAEDVEFALTQIQKRVPNAFVGMDVIVGFPGETEEEFLDTYARLSRLSWTRIHVFPYSERPGTKAFGHAEKISQSDISRRAKRLRILSMERFFEKMREQNGALKVVLPLKNSQKSQVFALSRDYWSIQIDKVQSPLDSSSERQVKITDFVIDQGQERASYLVGELIEESVSL